SARRAAADARTVAAVLARSGSGARSVASAAGAVAAAPAGLGEAEKFRGDDGRAHAVILEVRTGGRRAARAADRDRVAHAGDLVDVDLAGAVRRVRRLAQRLGRVGLIADAEHVRPLLDELALVHRRDRRVARALPE